MSSTVEGASPTAAPEGRFPTPLSLRALGYFAYQYKRTWRSSVTTSFLFPVLYLAAMGVGLGSLVDKHSHTVDGVTYLVFLAPGLLAGTAMQIGANEAMYPIMGAIKWMRTYYAMLATPLGVVNVLRGHLGWIAVRLTIVSSIYLAVMAIFGAVKSPLGILAFPASVATGMAFAAPIAAFSARQDRDVGFTALYRFGLIPLFLFSGTFFPVSQLPVWLQPLAYATPLYHGVYLCRGLVIGDLVAWHAVLSALYLVTVIGLGYAAARASFAKRLIV